MSRPPTNSGSLDAWVLRALAVVVALGVVVAGLGFALNDGESPDREVGEPVRARPAGGFLDSVGVNVHLTYYDTAYARFDEWVARLEELGVRHIRDGLTIGDDMFVDRLSGLAERGWRASLITSAEQGPAEASVALAAGPLRDVVETLEAPNEPDLEADWEAPLRAYLPELRRAIDERLGTSVPLLGPSFVDDDSREQLADTAGLAQLQNIHPYPGGEQPLPPEDLPAAAGRVMATETGYHNALPSQEGQPPVSEQAAAVYIPRLLAENYSAGIPRTFLYELLDEKPDPTLADSEQHFGLLRQDLSPKPAFLALRDLLRFVADSPGEGDGRDVRTKDSGEELERLLLERDDGSSVLLLWRRLSVWDTGARAPVESTPAPVQLRFGGEASDIRVSYPSRGIAPIGRPDDSHLEVLVGADVVAVSFR